MHQKTKFLTAALSTAAAITLVTATSHAAIIPVDVGFTTYGNSLQLAGGARIVGFAFTVNAGGATVSSLDYTFNEGQTSSLVQLYNAAGTIFASAIVNSTDPTQTTGTTGTVGSGGNEAGRPLGVLTYTVDTLANPVTLLPGVYYVTGLAGLNSVVPFAVGSPASADPSISYSVNNASSGVYNNPGAFTVQPTPITNGQGLTNSYFNVNIGITSAAVPEPTNFAGILSGAAMLLGKRRRRRSLRQAC